LFSNSKGKDSRVVKKKKEEGWVSYEKNRREIGGKVLVIRGLYMLLRRESQ